MLVIFRTVKPKHLKTDYGLTWTKCAYYKHTILTDFKVFLRSFSVNVSNLVDSTEDEDKPVSNDLLKSSPGRHVKRKSGKAHVSVVEKVRERFSVGATKIKRSRTFTATELEEEEKFAQFLSKEFEKEKEEEYGHHRKEKSEDLNDRQLTAGAGYRIDRSSKKTHRLPADWDQKFGTLATKDSKVPYKSELDPGITYMREIKEEEKESKLAYNHIPLGRKNRKHEPDWYSRRIVKLGKQGNIAEAIAVFDDWMITRDRVKPTDYEYSVLISLLGKVGYTKKAFSYFNEMVNKRYKIHPKVYSALFNACSNDPEPKHGLRKAQDLRRYMLVRNKHPNFITYQAMINAFGRCGDPNTAFQLADETAHFYRVNNNLLSSLLTVCISEKEAGFRHAIMAWRKFQKTNVVPTVTDYKLLLKCAKDCGVGDQNLLQQLLFVENETPKEMKGLLEPLDEESIDAELTNNLPGDIELSVETVEGHVEDVNAIEGIIDMRCKVEEASADMPEDKIDSNYELYVTSSDSIEHFQLKDKMISEHNTMPKKQIILPSVLDSNVDFSQVLSLSKIETRQDRFALLGNIGGFMKHLKEHDIKPDLYMFTLIMILVSIEEADLVLDEMLKSNVTPDVGFCNSYLFRLINAGRDIQDVLEVMKELKIKPNIGTYMELAVGCKNPRMAKAFLESMERAKVMPTRHVMNNLIKASTINFPYKTYVLQEMTKMEMKPNLWCLKRIELHISYARQRILDMDQGKIERHEDFVEKFNQFLPFYDKWLKETDVEVEEHPWKQFELRKHE